MKEINKEVDRLIGILRGLSDGTKSKDQVIEELKELRGDLDAKLNSIEAKGSIVEELIDEMHSDLESTKRFERNLNEQCRNLILKSGLDLKLPTKGGEVEHAQVAYEMAILKREGFQVASQNLDGDTMYILLKGDVPTHFFLEIHDDPHHAITHIFEVIDGDLEATLEQILS